MKVILYIWFIFNLELLLIEIYGDNIYFKYALIITQIINTLYSIYFLFKERGLGLFKSIVFFVALILNITLAIIIIFSTINTELKSRKFNQTDELTIEAKDVILTRETEIIDTEDSRAIRFYGNKSQVNLEVNVPQNGNYEIYLKYRTTENNVKGEIHKLGYWDNRTSFLLYKCNNFKFQKVSSKYLYSGINEFIIRTYNGDLLVECCVFKLKKN